LNLLRLPLLGRALMGRHARSALGLPLLLAALLMILDGLAGPQLAPKNLATVLTWVHYRGLVVLALLVAGNLFCMACPFMLVRNGMRRLRQPRRLWPRWLRHKGLALGLFVLLLFAYELFDLWASPRWTAWLIVAYFAAALAVDSLFRGASFCKYVCPLGQFNFVCSLVSPLEVKVQARRVCEECATKDCIKGRAASNPASPLAGLRGCELWLFQPQKVGNMDCTFCLDCAHACPYGNVGISSRLPGEELWADPRRSGIGRFSQRPDLAALAVLFTFGALLNAFAMVTPVYALETWLTGLLATESEALVLGLIFFVGLFAVPVGLVGLCGWLSWRGSGPPPRPSLGPWVAGYAFALVPLGFGIWLSHYAFHFLSGFWTFVPVVQSFVADILGSPFLGLPRWELGPLLPAGWLYPIELGFLGLGWTGSMLVVLRRAERPAGRIRWQMVWPWALLLSLLLAAAVWLMGQPMEMRGTLLAG
jgi:hypothetical protein